MILVRTLVMLVSFVEPCIVDSVVYAVTYDTLSVHTFTADNIIIDYVCDENLYVLTEHYLYKLDPDYVLLVDRIPLPQRFNYCTTDKNSILLVGTDEIIVINKNNLAFEKGIGIEHGDYRPLVSPLQMNRAGKEHIIYLINDTGTQSIVKIMNLSSGRITKTQRVPRIIYCEYEPQTAMLLTLDVDNRLTRYDSDMHTKGSIVLAVSGVWFSKHAHGYILYNGDGMFLVNKSGHLIDFQPIMVTANDNRGAFVRMTRGGIVCIDSLTLRPVHYVQHNGIVTAKEIVFNGSQYIIMVDAERRVYALNVLTAEMQQLSTEVAVASPIPPQRTETDSLWYLQLGAFTQYANAHDMFASLQEQGLPVLMDSIDLYRVKLGGFRDKASIIEIMKTLNLLGWSIFQKKIPNENFVTFTIGTNPYILEHGIITRSEYEKNN